MTTKVTLFRSTTIRKIKNPETGEIETVNVKGKKWHMKWSDPVTGRKRSKTTDTSNYQAACQIAAKKQDQLFRQKLGTYDPVEEFIGMLFVEARDKFLADKRARLAEKSVEAYYYSLLAFERLMKPRELRSIDQRVISDFVTRRIPNVGSNQTINKDLRHVRCFLNWCKHQNYLAQTPSFRGQCLPVEVAEPTWVSDDDVKDVLSALDDPKLVLTKCSAKWWGVFIRLALFTGMRRSELMGLCWSRVDFDTGTVRVLRSTSKRRRDRSYENAHNLTEMLRVWYDSHGVPPKPSDKVLPFARNPRGIYTDWQRILKHAGIPAERYFTPHDCRSSCVSEMLAAGNSITSVRDWVGHSSVQMTERYYAATRSDRRQIASKRKVV